MILIIVAMQAVATRSLKIPEFVQPTLDDFQCFTVAIVVNRIGLQLPNDGAIHNARPRRETKSVKLVGRKIDQVAIGQRPEPVAGMTEKFHSDARMPLIGYHVGRPRTEVLNSSDLHLRAVNIDPVVRKGIAMVQNE